MKLQKNTRLALYSVLEFARRPGEHVPASEVAERYGESAHHLAKVLSELARAGIVDSVRGQEDADRLFFDRALVMEGDTEYGLMLKNTLDAIGPLSR